MLNSYCHSARSYAEKRTEVIKILIDAARQGANLLSKKVDLRLLITFQNYVMAIMQLVSNKTNYNFSIMYAQFNTSIVNCQPQEQVKKTVEFLISIIEKL